MEKFSTLKSIPVHMPLSNIDTDMIIPKQFLKTIKRTGLGVNLFYEMRYDEKGNLIKDFVINRKPFSNSKILLAGKNFGCGSSREHAPWALLDFGIKCVISSSFADIFYSNCFKNGILPIVLDEKTIQELAEYSKRESEIEIKIETQEVLYGNKSAKFDLDSFKKKCLIEGIDDIGLSLEKAKNILDYENKIKNEKPWLNNND
ncbi:3-isopropylmalate dehydratase small subunit [Pelagibacteraceae bacterium]|jgi:3-isopropylmalate/(R)-2-methylmalate dehydratase small subunit|nr:3-isopropylmalate dehydratase small subunit [Pelagibacteraceae bacterium]